MWELVKNNDPCNLRERLLPFAVFSGIASESEVKCAPWGSPQSFASLGTGEDHLRPARR